MLLDESTLSVLKRCSQSLQAVRRKGVERGVVVKDVDGESRTQPSPSQAETVAKT